MRFTQRLLQGVVVVTLACSAGQALAAIPEGGVFTGCYQKSSGIVKLIDAATTAACGNSEMKVTWSQVGPQGPQGIQGKSRESRGYGVWTA